MCGVPRSPVGLPGRVRTRLATWGSTFSEGATQDGGAMAGVVNIFSASWVAGTTSARPLTVFSDPRTLSKMRDYPPFKRLASHQNNRLASANVLAKCLWSVNKRKAAGRSECQQRFQMAVGRLECRLCADQCIFCCAGVRTADGDSQLLVSYFFSNDLP